MLINLEKNTDFNEIISKNKKVLVDFYATWCGPCRMLLPVLEELAEELSDVQILKINVDEHQDLARAFGVTSIPTLFVFEDEKATKRLSGYMPKEALKEHLN